MEPVRRRKARMSAMQQDTASESKAGGLSVRNHCLVFWYHAVTEDHPEWKHRARNFAFLQQITATIISLSTTRTVSTVWRQQHSLPDLVTLQYDLSVMKQPWQFLLKAKNKPLV